MKRSTSGFTIVELLIVIVVIAILATISIVAYNGIQARAHTTAVQSDLANNAKKLEEYKILNGEYPDTAVKFRSAGIEFSQGSYSSLLFCVQNEGSSPGWALAAITASGGRFYRTEKEGFSQYTGAWNTWSAICETLGIDPPGGRWLYGGGEWTEWVVD